MVNELAARNKILTNVPFEKALTVEPLLENLKDIVLMDINLSLASVFPDGANLVIQSIEFAAKSQRILFEATKHGQALLDSGKAVLSVDKSGNFLPFIRDAKTGEIIEQLHGVSCSWVSKLVSFSAIIISAAHLISGADNARKLKRISDHTTLLVAVRMIDQMAELRSIYEDVRELFQENFCNEVRRRMKDRASDFIKLRHTWRGEIIYHLNQLDYEDSYDSKGWIRKRFTSQNSVDAKIEERITPLSAQLQLIEFTITMELLICQYCDGNDNWLSRRRLKEEVESIAEVKSLVVEKSRLIKKESIRVDWFINSFDDLIRKSQCFTAECAPADLVDVNAIRKEARDKNIGRNDLCPCGSYIKFKHCCGA